MREGELLRHIYTRSEGLRRDFPQVLVGPGHDCAAVLLPGGVALLKVDQIIEGRHFLPGTPLDLIARKSIARPVSDIAAAAGTPTAALAAAALPKGYPQEKADALFDAAAKWAAHFGCPLVGGDIASLPSDTGALALTVTVMGLPHPTRGPVLRSGAQSGDGIYVTGAIGGSFDAQGGGRKHLTFEPRVREAAWLADELGTRLHAMMDLSDGLGIDAGRMAAASGVGIQIDGPRVPLACGQLREALGSGEDYELLFAATGAVPDRCPDTGTAVTRIGEVLKMPQGRCRVRMGDGSLVDASEMGWEHRD